ncbi:YaeQ family protein [Catenovulum sp. 2E275]|uniref:YaeQ family protein n=1 Tax=Catenovulum sp. 2E275 TaxID=2980497 RepID=UPI0021D178E3|nr:YaeQ family protein [Catenovulum sp. 2E275]MCU4675794.1 YaeQ family protein [Catenovulum sp. 2E275]
MRQDRLVNPFTFLLKTTLNSKNYIKLKATNPKTEMGWAMVSGSIVVKADINVSHLDSQQYLHLMDVIALDSEESAEHFTLRLLSWALFRHDILGQDKIQLGRATQSSELPDLFVKRSEAQYQHWIEVDSFLPDRLEKAEAKSEHIWLFYTDQDKVSKLLKNINKHPNLQLVEISAEMITQLALQTSKNINWNVLIDDDHISVATDELYIESKLSLHHPLTVPLLDLIH